MPQPATVDSSVRIAPRADAMPGPRPAAVAIAAHGTASVGREPATLDGMPGNAIAPNQPTDTQPIASVEAATPALRDYASLDLFFADIAPRAFRFAEAGLRSREDALDAVQDAMARMIGYGDKPSTQWTPLFWSVLRSRIIDVQRRRRFRLGWLSPAPEPGDHAIDWADPGAGPERVNESRQSHARMVQALRTLPARQREAFTLRVLEELDVADTARAMGCSDGSVKTHLSRARAALQKQLGDVR